MEGNGTVVVTGASGFLGRAVLRRLASARPAAGLSHTQAGPGLWPTDLRDDDALAARLDALRPAAVVHLAAYRDPDFCERNPEEARRLNVGATETLCRRLPESVPLLFASTDYVFDGTRPPYREEDPVSPVNVYGCSKVGAEALVRARRRGVVLRIPLLIGAGATLAGSGFIGQMLADLDRPGPVEVDDVLMRFPTWIEDVAEAVAFLLDRGAAGLFHYSALRGATRYAWTREVAALLGRRAGHLRPSTAVVPRPARRPPNSQLAPDRLRAEGFDRFTDFAEVLRQVRASFAPPATRPGAEADAS